VRPHVLYEKLTPDIDVPVRPPRTGVNAASGVQVLGVEEAELLEVRTGVATHARDAGSGRLQPNELVAAVQDEVAPDVNSRMSPCAADP